MSRRVVRSAVLVVGGLALAAATSLTIVHVATHVLVNELVFERASEVPPRQVAVVLASGARPSRPSDAAIERLTAALDLMTRGGADKVLLSGQTFEVEAMRRFLAERGVPPSKIVVDTGSDRTLDTCDRLRTVYGLSSVVLVSQAEHVVRAVVTCRQIGVPAIGFVAPNFQGMAFWRDRAHELAALPLAWWDVSVRAR